MLGKSDKMCSIERSDVYLVNESRKLESVNRVHEIGEKSHSLLDHPRNVRATESALIIYQRLPSLGSTKMVQGHARM